MKAWQDELVHTSAALGGVALILALLWGIGAVAQGQVERAQARGVQQVHAQAEVLRCGGQPSRPRHGGCAAVPAAMDVDTAVAVVYR